MKKLLNITNHTLTKEQIEDAKTNLKVKEFLELPQELKDIWSNIDPEFNTEQLREHLKPLREWVLNNTQKGDFVLIQGEAVAQHIMVDVVFFNGRRPITATTKEVKEVKQDDGTTIKKSIFKHIRYKFYYAYQEYLD